MAARSTRVTVVNETDVPLAHIDDDLSHGEWTDPLRPPPTISPGDRQWMQSESDGVATGTEGHVRYGVGGSADVLWVHWDNPYVGTNFYEQSISGPYGLYFTGGKGDNTEVVFHLIPATRRAVDGFLPSTHGFAFSNHWPSIHITSISLPDPFGDIAVGNASWGLCGGMSFAARDYFEAGIGAPTQAQNPVGEGDALFDYIVRRLAQSLGVGDAADFVKFADPLYANTDDVAFGDGRSWTMARDAWPAIRDTIDSGHPCPIGIVTGFLPDVTHLGHQVCVYAYQLTGQQLTLWVYDPNSPGRDDITMVLDISRTDQHLIDVRSNINVGHSPVCFFTQSYARRDPLLTTQPGWRFCGSCRSLFYDADPDKGHCAAGGGHASIGLAFTPMHDMRETASTQSSWRYCVKCRAMFFDGYPDKGRCPAGDGHAAAGLVFTLRHDRPSTSSAQSDWRFCHKCAVLYFDGDDDKGRCAASGPVAHQAIGWTFVLPNDQQGATGATGQGDWRYCGRCQGLCFAPGGDASGSRCPAGGPHQAIGWNFVLPNDHQGAGPTTGQGDWRYCARCHGLCFAPGGDAAGTTCPAGGAHQPIGWTFYLPSIEQGAPATSGQPSWRSCGQCHGLYFNGADTKGRCPAVSIARHEAAGYNFLVDFASAT